MIRSTPPPSLSIWLWSVKLMKATYETPLPKSITVGIIITCVEVGTTVGAKDPTPQLQMGVMGDGQAGSTGGGEGHCGGHAEGHAHAHAMISTTKTQLHRMPSSHRIHLPSSGIMVEVTRCTGNIMGAGSCRMSDEAQS
jgi:hypothetical protein